MSLGQAITVNGGNQTLTLTTGTVGGQLTSVVNTTSTLAYKRQVVIAKITVITSCVGQRFGLQVVATTVTNGTAAPAVTLVNGNPATDFITSISTKGAKNATCTLQYTATATFEQGNSSELGNDIHTVTYTIQAQ